MVSTFDKDDLEMSKVISIYPNCVLPTAKPIIRLFAKKKQGHVVKNTTKHAKK